MTARGTSLFIDFKVFDDHNIVRIHSSEGALLTARGGLGRSKLAEFRAILNHDLLTFQQSLGLELLPADWEAVDRAVRLLIRRGRLMCKLIFDEQLYDAQAVFKKAFGAPDNTGTAWKQIDVRADFHTAPPFELLPILDLSIPEAPIDSPAALSAVINRFLGFSAIIRRIYTGCGGLDQNTDIDNMPRLNLKFFQNTDLAGSKHELAFLSHNQDAIELDGPWPPDGTDIDDTVATFARHLWDPTLRFDRSTANRADHFHHLSCHCDTSGATSEQYYLLLASDRATCQASICDVRDEFVTLELQNGGAQRQMGPIIFLNACATAQVLPTGISSFASLFLHDNHNRALIGTETALADTVAAEFSEGFYRRLLEGYTLGESIQLAKWRLVHKYNNPVALIYTMYANPDIKVTQRQSLWQE